jgi:hypothetical protein
MCFGGSEPAAPEIEYQGPSQADINRNQVALDDYRAQAELQQQQFSSSLQQQINEANAETARIQERYTAELEAASAAAAGAGSQEAANAYAVTATQTPATGAETTQVVKPKKNQRRTLKIAAGNTANQAGSGLNIGV